MSTISKIRGGFTGAASFAATGYSTGSTGSFWVEDLEAVESWSSSSETDGYEADSNEFSLEAEQNDGFFGRDMVKVSSAVSLANSRDEAGGKEMELRDSCSEEPG